MATDPYVAELFFGQRGKDIIIMPAVFEEFITGKLDEQSARQKAERKLREERAAIAERLKKQKNDTPKGRGKGEEKKEDG